MLPLTLQYGQIKPKTGAELFKKPICAQRVMTYIFCHLTIIKFPVVPLWQEIRL